MKKPTKRQVASALKKARKLIEKPENWCQGTSARDAQGLLTSPWDETACKWCPEGAVMAVLGPKHDGLLPCVWSALEDVVPRAFAQNTPAYNDKPGRRHRDVLRLFDKAIASLEAA